MKEEATKAEEGYRKSTFRDYFETLLVTMILLNFARIFVFQNFKIPTSSMEDNLLVGDHLVVNKFIFGNGQWNPGGLFPFREIKRGDIIVFRYPQDPKTDYVKRVIGLPGDVVSIQHRKVFVNGQPLHEPYASYEPEYVRSMTILPPDDMAPTKVAEDHYFAMGDNRDHSYDSRFWGPVPRANITGRPFLVYWSFNTPEASGQETFGDWVKGLGRVGLRFFQDTRWDRTFFIVDSKHHYFANHPHDEKRWRAIPNQ